MQRPRSFDEQESRIKYTRWYYPPRTPYLRIQVCHKIFLNTLFSSLQNVRIIVEKRRNFEDGICPENGREKHQNHTKVPKRNKILTYINMFPAYESYCSKSHKERKKFCSDFCISDMHWLYNECFDVCSCGTRISPKRLLLRNLVLLFTNPKMVFMKNMTGLQL
jgi:hypothetical protein